MVDIELEDMPSSITKSGVSYDNYNPELNRYYALNTYPLQMDGFGLASRDGLPPVPAIYFAVSERTGLLYIGRARNLNERWKSHHRFDQLKKYRDVRIAWVTFPGLQFEHLQALESEYIQEFLPPLNQTPVNEDFVDPSGRDPDKYYYAQVAVLKDSDFARYLTQKSQETGVKPRDQILLYASAHVDMLKK